MLEGEGCLRLLQVRILSKSIKGSPRRVGGRRAQCRLYATAAGAELQASGL